MVAVDILDAMELHKAVFNIPVDDDARQQRQYEYSQLSPEDRATVLEAIADARRFLDAKEKQLKADALMKQDPVT
jgi:transcription elongation GreA/GreB family factor